MPRKKKAVQETTVEETVVEKEVVKDILPKNTEVSPMCYIMANGSAYIRKHPTMNKVDIIGNMTQGKMYPVLSTLELINLKFYRIKEGYVLNNNTVKSI